MREAIDELSDDLPEEFYIPVSTAYTWLKLFREKLRLFFQELNLDPNRLECLQDLKSVPSELALGIFEIPNAWLCGIPHAFVPP